MKTSTWQSFASRLKRSTLAVLALASASPLSAQSTLVIGNVPGYPGATVAVPVSLQKATNATAAQFDVAFNTEKVTAGETQISNVLTQHVVRSREIAPGVRRVLAYSLRNAPIRATNQAPLAALSFTVASTEYVGSGPITPQNALLARPDATPINPVILTPGTIFTRPVNVQSNGAQFFLPSTSGSNYVIQATTNFVHWANILTNTATGDYLDLFDPVAPSFPYRFYRWRREP